MIMASLSSVMIISLLKKYIRLLTGIKSHCLDSNYGESLQWHFRTHCANFALALLEASIGFFGIFLRGEKHCLMVLQDNNSIWLASGAIIHSVEIIFWLSVIDLNSNNSVI